MQTTTSWAGRTGRRARLASTEDTMDRHMKILRGISGAGKSTLARELARPDARGGSMVCSADDYFVGPDGVYRFDPAQLGAAHGRCFRQAIEACQCLTGVVVVDNTNLSATEIAPYYLLGASYGYGVEIVTVHADPIVAAARAIHGAGAERILAMARVLGEEKARFAPWWTHRTVYA